jgi:hypothetical protein
MGSTNAKPLGQPTRLNAEAFAFAFVRACAKPLDLFGFLFSFLSGRFDARDHLDQNQNQKRNAIEILKYNIPSRLSFLILTFLLNFKISGAGCPPRIGSFSRPPGSGGLNGGDASPDTAQNTHFVFQSQ